jgi:hypothetical protein
MRNRLYGILENWNNFERNWMREMSVDSTNEKKSGSHASMFSIVRNETTPVIGTNAAWFVPISVPSIVSYRTCIPWESAFSKTQTPKQRSSQRSQQQFQ